MLATEQFMQKTVSRVVLILIYIAELVLISVLASLTHELIGHALPLAWTGCGIEEISFYPPAGAHVKPAVDVKTILNPSLYIIAFGGVFSDLGFALLTSFGAWYYSVANVKAFPKRRVIFLDQDFTPAARGFYQLFRAVYAGSVLTNSLPLFQFSFTVTGINIRPLPLNDGSLYLAACYLRGEWAAMGVGIATTFLLILGGGWILLGFIKDIFRGFHKPKEPQQKLRIRYRL